MKPTLALTMGDPAGIGPEVVLKVLSDPAVYRQCRPLVIGDVAVFENIRPVVGANVRFRRIDCVADANFAPSVIDVLRPAGLMLGQVTPGRPDPSLGEVMAHCLKTAFSLAQHGEIQGIVSAPLNKEALHAAGYAYQDELAFFADITGAKDTFFMGVMEPVWTVSIAEHVAFKDILELVKKDTVLWYTRQMQRVLIRVGISAPRMAMAALNPHAGEGGLFGTEEIDELEPAVRAARAEGINVTGPIPADIVFARALAGEFDGVVCMYHDHANTVRKLQPKEKGATLYMGLPVACTTTAHGTAYDIAGQGICDPGSMMAALRYAIKLSENTHG